VLVQVNIDGTKRSYIYEAPEGTAVGDAVTVPPPPWGRGPQQGTVTALGSDYAGPVKPVLSGWPRAADSLDWDMSDWGPEDLVVDGLVMALEGCGVDEDQVAVVTADGKELRVLGVRRHGGRVEIVVEIG
jgi:hypothetical protein